MFCFVAHLCTSASNEQLTFVQPKSNEASFFFFFCRARIPPPPFSSGPLHFHHYPNHCVSHGLLQSMDRRKLFFHVEYSECCFFFFFFLFLPSSKHDRNRNRKSKKRRELFQQYLILYTEKKLITWRQAFLGRQRGLGVFHCAHS